MASYNPFGSVPGAIGTPNPYGDLGSVYPNLSGTNAAASQAILGELRGQLSPETLANINNAAATYGVTSGMPGSGLAINKGPRDIGLATEDLQRKGVQDYNATIPTVSGTQTVSPALQTEIADRNSVYAAAPNPRDAQTYAQDLFNKYLATMMQYGDKQAQNAQAPPPQTPIQKYVDMGYSLEEARTLASGGTVHRQNNSSGTGWI